MRGSSVVEKSSEARQAAGFAVREHPDRAAIDAEIHARPVTPLTGPLRIRRAAFMPTGGSPALRILQAALVDRQTGARQDARQLDYESGGYRVTAEIHNEFATLTWIGALDDWTPWPTDIGLDLFSDMALIAATRIDLVQGDAIAPAALAGFSPPSLCYSALYDGQAQVATDFVIDEDRFTRYEVAAGRCGPLRSGVVVRRLLEIETYRSLVLLGLPVARAQSGKVHTQEQQLSTLVRDLGLGTSMQDSQRSLDQLQGLSLDVGRAIDETSFRFAATHAYAEVLHTRIDRLGEVSIAEFTTIGRYLANRVDPAVATCSALEKRLDALTAKLERSTELVSARISLGIETQNQAVLDTISKTGRSQYRLQQTVEGLSIIAISYYALALIGYIIEGFAPELPIGKGPLLALAAPIVLVVVWIAISRLRRHHD